MHVKLFSILPCFLQCFAECTCLFHYPILDNAFIVVFLLSLLLFDGLLSHCEFLYDTHGEFPFSDMFSLNSLWKDPLHAYTGWRLRILTESVNKSASLQNY